MVKIVISGYYGSKNAGDEAMLAAMLEVLGELEDISVTVISVNPDDTKRRHGVNAVPWLNIFAIVKSIIGADLVISGGGSLLQNVTSRRSLYYYLGIIFLARLLGRRVMLYAQGIGPIEGAMPRRLMHWIVDGVDLITVRDHGSLEELSRLSITRPRIECTADPVLAIRPASLMVGRDILRRSGEGKFLDDHSTMIGIAVRRWHGWDRCREQLARAADELAHRFHARIIFLPMQYPEDVRAAREVADISTVDVDVLDGEFSTGELLSLVGCMDLLISIRLHALIFAGVMNVPMLGISYDPKIDRFLDSIGEAPVGRLETVSADEIVERATEKLGHTSALRDSTLFKNLHDRALENARLAMELLRTKK
ncbi:MAG: polysaccharide pyruvyl transferase CsaB [Selenomonadaceae bacterium]|nr:polysaccharide pyruvyl transferase CsaB [Selenomonadaceae bacterium]